MAEKVKAPVRRPRVSAKVQPKSVETKPAQALAATGAPVRRGRPPKVKPAEPVAAQAAPAMPAQAKPVQARTARAAVITEAPLPKAAKAPSSPASKSVASEGNTLMNEAMENAKKYSDEAKIRFESAFAEISEKAKAGVEKSTKAVEELSDLAKGNVEALVESGRIAAKGIESLGQGAAEYGRMTFEKASAAMKSLTAAKTPAEFFQLQSELLSSNLDAFAKESAKSAEAMLKLAGDIAQPLSTRASIVSDKVKSIAA